jgi:hypothetical protein
MELLSDYEEYKGESITIVITLSKPMQWFGKGVLRVWSRR